MSRQRLRSALASRGGSPALVPLIEEHAARLEQLSPERWPADAEAQARMLRNVQALYGLDAVTIGAGGLLVASACWLAAMPALGAAGARSAARGARPLGSAPPPQAVAAAPALETARDVLRRLRPVLADRSGIAVVLPDASALAAQLGAEEAAGWAAEVLAEVLRALGSDEPDLYLLLGDDPVDPTLESLADFFGAALVPVGRAAPPGVVAIEPAALVAGAEPPSGWLYTTSREIDAGADPQAVRSAIALLRARARS